MTNRRPHVAKRSAAPCEGHGTHLLDNRPTGDVETVDGVGLDFDVARKRSSRRGQGNDEDRGRAKPEKCIRRDDHCWPEKSGFGADGGAEVDLNDISIVHASAQVRIEPDVAFGDVPRPLLWIGLQRRFCCGHLAVELIAPERLESGIERVGHRTRALFGELPETLSLADADTNSCRCKSHTRSLPSCGSQFTEDGRPHSPRVELSSPSSYNSTRLVPTGARRSSPVCPGTELGLVERTCVR